MSTPSVASAQNNAENREGNTIQIVRGLADQGGAAPLFFSYPLVVISRGESVTWQNMDTNALQVRISKTRSATDDGAGSGGNSLVFESQRMDFGKTSSFKFEDAGSYRVSSSADSSLNGEIIVADKMTTMTNTKTSNGSVNVELSWTPEIPQIGEKTYFKIRFLDKQTGQPHEHIDYTFSLLNSTGSEVGGTGLVHSVEGKDYPAVIFKSEGTLTPVVTVHGISFSPITPDESKFSIVVTPEFPSVLTLIIMASAIGTVIAFRLGRSRLSGLLR